MGSAPASAFTIVLARGAPPVERFAASELRLLLLELCPDTAARRSNAYVLSGGRGAARGTLYAVYELVHLLGVRFFAANVTHLPASGCPADLGGAGSALPTLAMRQHHPALEYRYVDTVPASLTMEQHMLWLVRNRFNVVTGEDWRAPVNGSWWTPEHGGGWTTAIGFPEATSYTILGDGLATTVPGRR